ncbi:MAG: hypothetical protein MPJ50_18830 [Pirellulales bacterium]|nr:hypothetical protein [Pirellulales bacterium]
MSSIAEVSQVDCRRIAIRYASTSVNRLRPVLFSMSTLNAHPRTGKRPAITIDTGMMTFHEWLRERHEQQKGLLLGSDGRLKGLSPMNPLPKDSAFNKSLKQKPKPLPAAVPVFKPWKPASQHAFSHSNRHSLRRS